MNNYSTIKPKNKKLSAEEFKAKYEGKLALKVTVYLIAQLIQEKIPVIIINAISGTPIDSWRHHFIQSTPQECYDAYLDPDYYLATIPSRADMTVYDHDHGTVPENSTTPNLRSLGRKNGKHFYYDGADPNIEHKLVIPGQGEVFTNHLVALRGDNILHFFNMHKNRDMLDSYHHLYRDLGLNTIKPADLPENYDGSLFADAEYNAENTEDALFIENPAKKAPTAVSVSSGASNSKFLLYDHLMHKGSSREVCELTMMDLDIDTIYQIDWTTDSIISMRCPVHDDHKPSAFMCVHPVLDDKYRLHIGCHVCGTEDPELKHILYTSLSKFTNSWGRLEDNDFDGVSRALHNLSIYLKNNPEVGVQLGTLKSLNNRELKINQNHPGIKHFLEFGYALDLMKLNTPYITYKSLRSRYGNILSSPVSSPDSITSLLSYEELNEICLSDSDDLPGEDVEYLANIVLLKLHRKRSGVDRLDVGSCSFVFSEPPVPDFLLPYFQDKAQDSSTVYTLRNIIGKRSHPENNPQTLTKNTVKSKPKSPSDSTKQAGFTYKIPEEWTQTSML